MGLTTPAPAWCWGWELSGRARSGPPAWLCLAAPLSPPSLSPQESASGCGGASTISSNPTALSSARSPKKAPFCFPLPNQGGRKSEWETKEAKRNLSERLPSAGGRDWAGLCSCQDDLVGLLTTSEIRLPSAKESQANGAVHLPFQAAEKMLEGISNKTHAEIPKLLLWFKSSLNV